jgi:mRNA interferase MazF
MDVVIERFGVYLIRLDPVIGSEMRKTRPCVVLSPDSLHRHLHTVLIAPLTTTLRAYPSRVGITFAGREGQIALDQLRAVDRVRLRRQLGKLPPRKAAETLATLQNLFAVE